MEEIDKGNVYIKENTEKKEKKLSKENKKIGSRTRNKKMKKRVRIR